jgi:hypothetical protein
MVLILKTMRNAKSPEDPFPSPVKRDQGTRIKALVEHPLMLPSIEGHFGNVEN